MKLTIRKKLLGLSFIAIVIPLIISAAVIVYIVNKKSSDESIKRIQSNSHVATTQYARRMQALSITAKQMAITALQYDFVEVFARAANPPTAALAAQYNLERDKAVNVMDILKKQTGADYVILADANGRVIHSLNNPQGRGTDLGVIDPMLREALGSRKVNYGSLKLPIDFVSLEKMDAFLSLGAQKKSIEAALAMEVVVPLILGGDLRGALLVGDVLNNDNTMVDELKTMLFRENPEAGSATIYLNEIAIASSRSGTFGRGIGDNISKAIYDLVERNGKEYIGPETIGNFNYVSAYVPVKDITNRVIGIYSVSMREEWFLEFQTFIRNFIVVVILAAIVISILLTYITAGRLTRPIEDITEAANKISLGDLDVSIQVKTAGDEIERLGESLERMRVSLKSAIERLRRR